MGAVSVERARDNRHRMMDCVRYGIRRIARTRRIYRPFLRVLDLLGVVEVREEGRARTKDFSSCKISISVEIRFPMRRIPTSSPYNRPITILDHLVRRRHFRTMKNTNQLSVHQHSRHFSPPHRSTSISLFHRNNSYPRQSPTALAFALPISSILHHLRTTRQIPPLSHIQTRTNKIGSSYIYSSRQVTVSKAIFRENQYSVSMFWNLEVL